MNYSELNETKVVNALHDAILAADDPKVKEDLARLAAQAQEKELEAIRKARGEGKEDNK